MGLKFRKSKIKLNFLDTKPELYKIQQVNYDQITFDQLLEEVAQTQGQSKAQTQGVILALLNRAVHYMEIGHPVSFGKFGSFKPTFTAKAAKTLEEADSTTVRRKVLRFYPGKDFKTMLKDLTVTGASSALDVEQPEEPDGEGGDGGGE